MAKGMKYTAHEEYNALTHSTKGDINKKKKLNITFKVQYRNHDKLFYVWFRVWNP